MRDIDLPLTLECKQCHGKGFLYIIHSDVRGLYNSMHREEVACANCNGTGEIKLEALELESTRGEVLNIEDIDQDILINGKLGHISIKRKLND